MNKEETKRIIKLLNEKFKNKEIYINITGAIETTVIIPNMKYFISKNTIIFSNGEQAEFEIDPYWIEEIKVTNKSVKIDMEGGYSINIDY